MSLFVAAQTAFVEYAGKRVRIVKDETIARIGHAILEGNEHLFKRLHVHYDVERAKPPTPPTPPVKKAAPKATASAGAASAGVNGESEEE